MRRSSRTGPSQSQGPAQSQTQRPRNSRNQMDLVSEEEGEEQHTGEEDEEDGDDMQVEGTSETSQKANDLVRLALFTEHKRSVLRREDINKKVLGQRAGAFNTIFAIAQQKLKATFGMELVELPSRSGLEQENTHDAQSQDAPVPTGIKKRANTSGSKTYILRSCLDPLLIEHVAQTYPEILEEEGGDQGTLFPSTLDDDPEEDGDDDTERPPKFYGSLVSWSRADQLGSIGILYVILALVLVNGRVLTDTDLRRYLKTLHLPSNPAVQPVRFDASSTVRAINIDTYLSNLLKHGYLDRQQVGGDAARKGKKGGGSKRLRTQAEDLEEGIMYEWRWGPRAHCEVGEENIGKFVAEFMVDGEVNEEEEGGHVAGRRGGTARRKQETTLKKMYSGVEKAAGGKLAELK